MLVIVVTGKRGSGKDTLADYLEKNHGFNVLEFSRNAIKPILDERKLEFTRQNLIEIAMSERKKKGNGYFALLICNKMEEGNNYCVTGMRFKEELDVFREKFSSNFFLLSIICDERERYERIINRGDKGESDMTFEQFLEIEKKPTERAINEIIDEADFFIDNNGTIDEFYKNIEIVISHIMARPGKTG